MDDRPPPRRLPEPKPTRIDRQRAEIARLIGDGHLHRAADLGHEHLAEYPDDGCTRSTIVAALETSADRHVQRRVLEFVSP